MLLIIHNLPANMSLANIKQLIKDNCGAEEVILDNLINEGPAKRVTVGLADETDAALLVRKINGLFLGGHQLFVEDIRLKKLADQPYRPQNAPVTKLSDPVNQQLQFENSSSMQIPQMMAPPAYSNMPFYMTPVQNPYENYEKATVFNPLPQVPFYQQDLSFGYERQPGNQNRWIEQPAVSYPDKKVSLSNSNAKAKGKSSRRDRKQDFSMERTSNLRERRESPPRRGEDRRRRAKYDKRYNEPDPRRDIRRSLSRERKRYLRKPISRHEEYKKSNRFNKIERSPPRDRRFNRDNVDRGRGCSDDRRGRAIKRHRGFNSRERDVNSREQDYDFGKLDYDTGNRDYDTNSCDYNTGNRNIEHEEYDFHGNEERSSFDMPENREERDNYMYEQTYHETDFEIIGSYSEQIEINPTTFSNNPNDSTFSNFNPDTYIQSSTSFNAPPKKVPRFNSLDVDKSGLVQPATTITNHDSFAKKSMKKPFVIPLNPRVNQHSNFFARAAGIIARDIMKKEKVGYLKNYMEVHQHLKKCIESRIDVITQDQIPNTLKEVIQCYRFKFGFAEDPKFFKAVLEKTNRGTEDFEHPNPGDTSVSEDDFQNNDMSFVTANKNPGVSANQQPKGFKEVSNMAGQQGPNKFQPNKMPKSSRKKKPNPAANVPVQQEQSKRLPRFPQGNKQLFKDQKKLSKMEYMIEDIYNLDPTLLNALNEELRKLCEAYLMGSSQPAVDEEEEKTRLILRKRTPYTFKKVMRIHLSKRLLNITDNLIIRIFAHPKYPKRDELDQFLREVGITSVRKSDTRRLYLAMAPSYEVYDHLLTMQHTKIGDISLQFRPLHLTGPNIKKKHLKKNNQPEDKEDDDESGNDEELERLIEETENKIIEKTENVNVAGTGNVEHFAGTVAKVFDDDDHFYTSYDEIGPDGLHAGDANDDYTKDIDVVIDNANDVVMFEDDKNNVMSNSKSKKEIKDEEARETIFEPKVVTENNNKADNVQVDNSKTKVEINIKSNEDAKENTEILNKEADDPEKGNEVINKSGEVTVADSAEVNEENLCAVDVDDDDLEDF